MTRPRMFVVAVLVAVAVAMVVPTTDIVTPDWEVLVTDTNGQPVSGATVSLFSQQYTLEATDQQVDKLTDVAGKVHFDQRLLRANAVMRMIGVLRGLDEGVHASFGVHTHVHASKNGYSDPSDLEHYGANEQQSRANGAAHQSSHLILLQCKAGDSSFGCSFPIDPRMPVLEK